MSSAFLGEFGITCEMTARFDLEILFLAMLSQINMTLCKGICSSMLTLAMCILIYGENNPNFEQTWNVAVSSF